MQNNVCKNRRLQPDRDILGLAAELARLNSMGVHELRERFHEVFGFPAKSSHRAYLRKKLAFRTQEISLKGLSEEARFRIKELATETFPEPRRAKTPSPGKKDKPRDVRLPPLGSVLVRNYQDKIHEVKVLGDGFEYEGKHYRSLSKVARAITGMQWNGYIFFHCAPRRKTGVQP
jgi:hypothetical protein